MKSAQNITNWNDFDEIDEIPPFSGSEQACLDEIRQVLERHGKQHLFGVVLLHKHFDLEDDEILLEEQNPSARSISSHAVKVSELAGKSYKVTSWRLDHGTIRPIGCCAMGMYGQHYGYKDD